MSTTVHQFPISGKPMCLHITFKAAGHDVATSFRDGNVFISVREVDAELNLPLESAQVKDLIRQLQQRMDDLEEEIEWGELSSAFRIVA